MYYRLSVICLLLEKGVYREYIIVCQLSVCCLEGGVTLNVLSFVSCLSVYILNRRFTQNVLSFVSYLSVARNGGLP